MINTKKISFLPFLQALTAALLFGVSAPLAKLLLGEIDPIPLAGFLYLGSGLGLLLYQGVRKKTSLPDQQEARLQKEDLPWLAGASLTGGVIAPILLLFGLQAAPAASASLLLNFEGVATTLIAVLVFGEAVGRRVWLAIVLVTAASILLSLDLQGDWGVTLGLLGVLAACVFWGLDNNLTRQISAKDPISIVMIKGFTAGTFSLLLAFFTGSSMPAAGSIVGALLLGSLSYGLSITLFIRAMRGLGAARTSALFATAPAAGIVLSFLIYREKPDLFFLLALPLMIAGTLLMLGENHQHRHTHLAESHEHWHRHDDEHHHHEHPESGPGERAHSHQHQHANMEHIHQHLPDQHHRHQH